MDATRASETGAVTSDTTAQRTSDRELVVTRTVDGPPRIVFEAWTTPELFQRWWVPKSFPITLVSCELDVREAGGYRLVFGHEGSTFEFFGRYLEVTPPSRLVWTNDEGDDGGAITTATFEDVGGRTRVVVHDLYPSAAALDAAIAAGSTGLSGMPEQLEQLDDLLVELAVTDRR